MKKRSVKQSSSGWIILAILATVILGVTVTAGCAPLQSKEKFTEFYILGPEGKATGYPEELKVGEEGTVTVVVINREQEETKYRLEVRIDGVTRNERESIELMPDQKWEERIGFTPEKAGKDQKVEFLLYKNGRSEVYLDLHLWIDVDVT
jgi:uncharacterized membrane protein